MKMKADHAKYIDIWYKVFDRYLKEVDEMVRVSGVPYEVDLSSDLCTLEQENKQMRARMNRLEDENRQLETEILELRMKLHNLTFKNE